MAYNYSKDEIEKRVYMCLEILRLKDFRLFQIKCHERTIAHKLGEYLQMVFPDWNVDLEYNRMDPELSDISEDTSNCSDDESTGRIFPDLIVHRRGLKFKNLLVVEIKTIADDREHDYEKLESLTELSGNFRYKTGLFLKFDSKGKYEPVWFDGGKKR